MKINRLKTKDIYGLNGDREFDLSDEMTCLFGKNGAGKSSFLRALNFAVSGIKTPDMIYAKAGSAAVMFETDTGLRIDRLILPTQAGNYSVTGWLNKQKAPSADIQTEIASGWGTTADNLKLLSASDIENSLEQDAGRILLSYASNRIKPEHVRDILKKTDLKSPLISDEIIDSISMPDQGMDWTSCRALSAAAVQKRRESKASLQQFTAVRQDLYRRAGTLPEDSPTVEEAQKELEQIRQTEAYAAAGQKALTDYNNAMQYRNRILADIKQCEDALAAYTVREDAEQLRMQDKNLLDIVMEADRVIAAADATINSLSPLYNRLGTGICPIYDKIRCTTDMSDAKASIKKQIDDAGHRRADALSRKAQAVKAREDLAIRITNAGNAKMLQDRIASETDMIPPEPAMPQVMQIPDYTLRKQFLQTVISHDQTINQLDEINERIRSVQKDVYVSDFLARAFADDGPVVAEILKVYVDSLIQAAAKAEQETRIGVLFTYGRGLDMKFRVNGQDPVCYSSLSSGEKMLAFLTVSDLLHRVASIPVLLIDNADRLDDDNLDRLLTLLDRVSDSYGNIIIAGVNHPGTDEILQKHGLHNMLEKDKV